MLTTFIYVGASLSVTEPPCPVLYAGSWEIHQYNFTLRIGNYDNVRQKNGLLLVQLEINNLHVLHPFV